MTAAATGYYFNGLAAIAGGVLIAGAAIAAYRMRLLPRWLSVVGLVVALASVPASLLGMWIIVESLWLAIPAGLLVRRAGPKQPAGVRLTGGAAAGARG